MVFVLTLRYGSGGRASIVDKLSALSSQLSAISSQFHSKPDNEDLLKLRLKADS